MIELIIDQRFKSKIPHLTDEEFEMLEKNILADGEIREPLVVWKGKGIIVDGHNRHRIWQSHPELPEPRIKEIDFADEWAAISWMCGNQLGRRNVSNAVKAELIAQKYEAEKHTHGGNRKTGEFSKPNNWGLEIETDEEHEHKSKRSLLKKSLPPQMLLLSAETRNILPPFLRFITAVLIAQRNFQTSSDRRLE